jgi:hypothetical protein
MKSPTTEEREISGKTSQTAETTPAQSQALCLACARLEAG